MTSSPVISVRGKQDPRLRIRHETVRRSDGDLAAKLGSDYGLVADDWQQLVLEDWLSFAEDQRWAARTCALSAPRQNGKNFIIELREIYGMVGRGEAILHTAHRVRTAQEHFRRLRFFFGDKANDPNAQFPELNRLVSRIRSANGQEGVFLKNGGRAEVGARSGPGGRGLTFDVLVCDEAQDMSDAELEALSPTISAAPLGNPQFIVAGTPPGPRSNGEAFGRLRTEAMSGKSKRMSWIEWSPADASDLDDPSIWAAANPGLGIRLHPAIIEDERARFSDEGFARERLGMWSAAASNQVIDPRSWRRQEDPNSLAVDDLALAVDVAPDRSMAAVAVAGRRADGGWHIELEEHRSGLGWVEPHLLALVEANPNIRAVVVDAMSAADTLTDALRRSKVNVTRAQTRDVAAACGSFYDGALEGWLFHLGQPQLSFALSVARKRSLLGGEAWAWNRKTAESDITPLVAATLALWGAQNSKVTKPRKRSNNGSRRVMVL